MKLNSSCVQLRRLAIIGALGSSSIVLSAATPITKGYTFTSADLMAATGAQTYVDSGATLLTTGAGTGVTYARNAWFATVAAPNSQFARNDATPDTGDATIVPAGWFLQSVTFTYNLSVVNWVGVERDNTSAANTTVTFASSVWLVKDFASIGSANNQPPGSTLIATELNTTSPQNLSFGADDGDGTPTPAGSDFPFVDNFSGVDSYIRGNTTAHTTSTPNDDPLSRSFGNTTTLTSGAVFADYEGVTSGTINTTFAGKGTGALGASAGFTSAFRAFSTGDFTITFTFVPEASTWASGAFVVLLGGAFSARRYIFGKRAPAIS